MKIGDEVYIHGFVDEIRKDTVIIRNKGGYFGTDAEEVAPTVERKKGKWVGFDSDTEKYDDVMCSNCKKIFTVDAYRWCDIGFVVDDLKFCPNCGADMRIKETDCLHERAVEQLESDSL